MLGDAAVHRLCRSRSRDRGLIAEQVLLRADAVDFAVDVLPRLEAGGQVEITEVGGRPDYHAATEAPVVRFAARGSDDDDATHDSRLEFRPQQDGEYRIEVGDKRREGGPGYF